MIPMVHQVVNDTTHATNQEGRDTELTREHGLYSSSVYSNSVTPEIRRLSPSTTLYQRER